MKSIKTRIETNNLPHADWTAERSEDEIH